jgi:hypothetical protein
VTPLLTSLLLVAQGPPPSPSPVLSVTVRSTKVDAAPLRGAASQEVRTERVGIDVGYLKPSFKTTQNLTLRVERSSYRVSPSVLGQPGRVFGDFLEDNLLIRAGATFLTPRSPSRTRVLGVSLDMAASESSDLTGALAGGLFVAERVKASPTLTWTYGVGVRSQIADKDFLLIPALGVDWQAQKNLRVLVQGQEARITRTLSKSLTVASVTTFDIRRAWRLSDASQSGIIRENNILTGLELGYSPTPQTSVALFVGWMLERQLQREDSAGRLLERSRLGNSSALGIRFNRRL